MNPWPTFRVTQRFENGPVYTIHLTYENLEHLLQGSPEVPALWGQSRTGAEFCIEGGVNGTFSNDFRFRNGAYWGTIGVTLNEDADPLVELAEAVKKQEPLKLIKEAPPPLRSLRMGLVELSMG